MSQSVAFSNEIKKIWQEILSNDKITICTHVNADGDTIGSALALKEIILHNTVNKDIKISGEKYPRYLSFMPGNDIVSNEFFADSLKIVVDTSSKKRVVDERLITKESIKIDHHHNEDEWLLSVSGDHWPATGQLLVEICEILELEIPFSAKEYLFVAIWTDTEGLTQRNISDDTYHALDVLSVDRDEILSKMVLVPSEKKHINALKNKMEKEGNVSFLLTSDFVSNDYLRQFVSILSNSSPEEVTIIITKHENGSFRGELRSKGNIDVSIFAKKFGGGGHFASSGFICKDIEEAGKRVVQVCHEVNNI